MKNFTMDASTVPELVEKLGQIRNTLDDNEKKVFAEMVTMAARQAQELKDQKAVELVGGANPAYEVASFYAKPVSAIISFDVLEEYISVLFGL
jgi:hypothetical protein